MPILVCRCRACGKDFEYLSRGESDVPECPDCRGRSVERRPASFAVSAAEPAGDPAPACTGDPGSCGRCRV
jgi:putative FmdB family regulatory protein